MTPSTPNEQLPGPRKKFLLRGDASPEDRQRFIAAIKEESARRRSANGTNAEPRSGRGPSRAEEDHDAS